MKFDFVVLGATGEQGSIASRDLLKSGYSVLLCGRNPSRIKHLISNKKAKFAYVDLNDVKQTTSVMKKSGATIALNCAEFRINLSAMKACLNSGLHYLDLGGLQEMTRQQYKLNSKFKKKGLTSLLGCGSTPGISNVLVAYAVKKLDSVKEINLGFAWDSNIKEFVLPYSFESIVDEFTKNPVVLTNGKFKSVKACFPIGKLHFMGIGKQHTYCIVHSEVFTFAKYFRKKGLKNVYYRAGFPEHSFNALKLLIGLGFGSNELVKMKGVNFRIVDFTRAVLKRIEVPKGYKETENIWARVSGIKNWRKKNIDVLCLVKTVKGWEDVGSNIDTGMTISIMAQMLKDGMVEQTGVTAPEVAIAPEPFFKELIKRGMHIYINQKTGCLT